MNVIAFSAMLALGATTAHAASNGSAPSGDAMLTVTVSSQSIEKRFSLEDLQKIGVAVVETSTPWTNGTAKFEGVYLEDILSGLNIEAGTVKAIALNDYSSTLPVTDAYKHSVLLAYKIDGKQLSVRDKGPLWIVYPFDADPSLKSEVIYSRSVWQLNRLVVSP